MHESPVLFLLRTFAILTLETFHTAVKTLAIQGAPHMSVQIRLWHAGKGLLAGSMTMHIDTVMFGVHSCLPALAKGILLKGRDDCVSCQPSTSV